MSASATRLPGSCRHPEWQTYWEHIHADRDPAVVSWYQAHPEHSLSLIDDTGIGSAARILDVGGGASTLIDHLLSAGYRNLTVLDIAAISIERARLRLGERARQVNWLVGDVTNFTSAQPFDVWHDRAVFHFLTNEQDRAFYVESMLNALTPNGQAIIATFSDSGPSQCSGLEVVRYNPAALSNTLGACFHLVETFSEEHHTPYGGLQEFIYCRFCRNSEPATGL
jgi:2-polyprenyl-3-methyl-5-hydroxy-6-metoxy-1,4-benzoquinol methylase